MARWEWLFGLVAESQCRSKPAEFRILGPRASCQVLAVWSLISAVSVKVKICGITNIADAQVAVQAGADALGLMLYSGSSRYIPLETAQEIARSLPPSVMRVGVFVDPEPADVFAAVQSCGLSLLQFHGAETSQFCQQFGVMTMKAFRMRNAESLAPLESFSAGAFLLDSYVPDKAGGTGETFNWELAVEAKKFGRPIFLAGGLTPANVAEAIRVVQPFGVDVSSGVEFSPGRKDPEKIRAFIAAAKGA
jgi:phosphoribosylanthranilate isomerase